MPFVAAMLAEPANTKHDYINDDAYWFEQKLDGIRLIVEVDDGKVYQWKRSGTLAGFPEVKRAFSVLPGHWRFDGEWLDGQFHVFDLPESPATDFADTYEVRRHVLEAFVEKWAPASVVQVVRCARTPAEKQDLFDKLQAAGAEGVMVKRHDAPYRPGLRTQFTMKMKFWKSCEVVVLETCIDGKENASLGLFDAAGKLQPVGKASTIGKGLIQPGQIVEAKYLYMGAGGRLVQPEILRVRDDKQLTDCTFEQDISYVNKAVV
jgi:bifunctional non-homologous end joining protein LigD